MGSSRRWRRVALAAGLLAIVVAAATVGRSTAFHILPLRWTGEARRLATALDLRPGSVVADIGAGDGELAVEIARSVGTSGTVYATEITEPLRAEIADTARRAGLTQIRVTAAQERATGLPDACCDAVYLRTVLHHIQDRQAFAKDLRRTLKPGGRLAIIDFPPSTFFHLAADHGVTAEYVIDLLTAAGFRLERRVDDWGGNLFLVLFRS